MRWGGKKRMRKQIVRRDNVLKEGGRANREGKKCIDTERVKGEEASSNGEICRLVVTEGRRGRGGKGRV